MKTFDLIEVSWMDSRMYLTQQSMSDEFEPCLIHSVGFELHNDKQKVVLMGDIIENDCRRVLVIPKKDIIKIRALTYM